MPRATNDVDLNVFVRPEELGAVVGALRALGIPVDAGEAVRRAASDGVFTAGWGLFRVDLFTPSIEFSWEAERTRVRESVGDGEAWFLSAEALCVFKPLFFRGKDRVDLERLVGVQGSAVDAAYVRRWIVDMVGADDPRVAEWDRICREYGGRA